MTPHQPIEICPIDPGLAADRCTVACREAPDDLLGVHEAQYTYPSEENKTHMYNAPPQNGGMGEKQLRQILARNVADRMHRDPGLDTQTKLSVRAKVAQPHISRILRSSSAATIDVLAALADAFKCQPWELLVDTEITRQSALRQMILGPTVADERVAEALGAAPNKISAMKRRRAR